MLVVVYSFLLKKNEEIIQEQIFIQGRLVHIKYKNIVSGETINLFSLYGKSGVNKTYAEFVAKKINNEIDNGLENIVIVGDLNFVTSVLDRNSNSLNQIDLVYKPFWLDLEIKHSLLNAFRTLYPKRRLYSFSQTGGNAKSCIDRIYLSSNIVCRVKKYLLIT